MIKIEYRSVELLLGFNVFTTTTSYFLALKNVFIWDHTSCIYKTSCNARIWISYPLCKPHHITSFLAWFECIIDKKYPNVYMSIFVFGLRRNHNRKIKKLVKFQNNTVLSIEIIHDKMWNRLLVVFPKFVWILLANLFIYNSVKMK